MPISASVVARGPDQREPPAAVPVDAYSTSLSGLQLPPEQSSLGVWEFALLFEQRSAFDDLVAALGRVLPAFGPVGGRMSEDLQAFVCNNGGVPVSHAIEDGPAPSFKEPLPSSLFDSVKDIRPIVSDEMADTAAILRIRVTDFSDGQVIAISFNHILANARGLFMLLKAWSDAYRSEAAELPVISHNRTEPVPPPPDDLDLPSAWRALRAPAPATRPVVYQGSLSLAVWAHTSEKLNELKARYSSPDGPALSSNDALVAELVDVGKFAGETLQVMLVKDFQDELGAPDLFGQLQKPLVVEIPNSGAAAAATLRGVLPAAKSKDFAAWAWHEELKHVGELFVNSWRGVFDIDRVSFVGPAHEMAWSSHVLVDIVGKCFFASGIRFWVTVFPLPDGGAQVAAVLPSDVGQALQESGLATVTPLCETP